MPYCSCGNKSAKLSGGDCYSCLKAERKKDELEVKSLEKKEKWLRSPGIKSGVVKSAGNKNTSLCSDGSRVTQDYIDRKRSEAYKAKYEGVKQLTCHGCRLRKAHGSMHIIPQAMLKQLGKTELIWDFEIFYPGCIQCNNAMENPGGQNWKKIIDIEYYLTIIKKHAPILWQKFMNNVPNQDKEPTI